MSKELKFGHTTGIDPIPEVQVPEDFSDLLIDQLGDALNFIRENVNNKKYRIKLDQDPATFRSLDVYPNYEGTRLIASKEDTPKIDIAAATIKKPIRVFRDILVDKKDGRESTYMEHYFGLHEYADGRPAIVYVLTNRNLIIKAVAGSTDKAAEYLSLASGLEVYRAK